MALVTQDLDDSVDVKYAARDVVPTRGAVVLAPFETSVGYRLMLTLKGRDGRALPFGSRIENEAGQEVGIVGPEGQAYVSGAPEAGTLKVIWGQDAAAQCEVKYALPARKTLADPPVRRQLLMMPRVHPCMPECLRLEAAPTSPCSGQVLVAENGVFE